MSLYSAFEWIVITLLLFASLRVLWQRVLQPALLKPKVACGTGGCNNCSSQK